MKCDSSMTTGSLCSSTTAKQTCLSKQLPDGYEIGEDDVYIGRASVGKNSVGNKRFRTKVLENAERYCRASSKIEKTAIIYEIIDYVRAKSPLGGFVRKDLETGYYFEVGDVVAREKVSQAFRDAIKGIYKSSSVMKARDRRRKKMLTCKNVPPTIVVPGNQDVDKAKALVVNDCTVTSEFDRANMTPFHDNMWLGTEIYQTYNFQGDSSNCNKIDNSITDTEASDKEQIDEIEMDIMETNFWEYLCKPTSFDNDLISF